MQNSLKDFWKNKENEERQRNKEKDKICEKVYFLIIVPCAYAAWISDIIWIVHEIGTAQYIVSTSEGDELFNTTVRLNFIAGNCWLVAAIESLRHQVNRESFSEVVQACGNDLEFRWDNNFGGGQILDPFIQLQWI